MAQRTLFAFGVAHGPPTVAEDDFPVRCSRCRQGFWSKQGLGRHRRSCSRAASAVAVPAASAVGPESGGRRPEMAAPAASAVAAPKVTAKAAADGRAGGRGSDHRVRVTTGDKLAKVAAMKRLMASGLSQRQAAQRLRVNQSMLSRWARAADAGKFADEGWVDRKVCRSRLLRNRFGDKLEEVERLTLAEAKSIRHKKWPLTQRRIGRLARRVAKRVQPEGFDGLRFSRSWIRGFARRNLLKRRAVTNRSLLSRDEEVKRMRCFHWKLRERCLRHSVPGVYEFDPAHLWGRFQPVTRFNMDEVPWTFDLGGKSTYTFPNERVRGNVPLRSAGSSRFATMVLTTAAGGAHCRPLLVRRGGGGICQPP